MSQSPVKLGPGDANAHENFFRKAKGGFLDNRPKKLDRQVFLANIRNHHLAGKKPGLGNFYYKNICEGLDKR
jgi:hypothetical protein